MVCYNIPLSKMLKEQFKDFSCVVNVNTFKKLLYEITEKRWQSDQEKEKIINLAVRILEGETPEYDHIFVDECQDLIGDQWPVLFQKLWKGNEDDSGTTEAIGYKYKWFFYDTNQYMGWSGEHLKKHEKAPKASFRLSRVLRNTGNIFNQSKKYLQPSSSCPEEITLGHDECGLNIEWKAKLPPGEVTEKEGAKLVAECIDDLRKRGVLEADICVLVQNEKVRDFLSPELKELHVDNYKAEKRLERNKNMVVVESIRRFKGLESKVVILYNPKFTVKYRHIKELLYTAFSRCSCYLVVITSTEGMKALQSVDGVRVQSVDGVRVEGLEYEDDDDFDVEVYDEDEDDDKDGDGSTHETVSEELQRLEI